MITQAQRRKIFALSKLLKLNDENRRLIQQSVCGKESLSKATKKDAIAIITQLNKMIRENSLERGETHNHRVHHGKVYNLISPQQISKIQNLSISIYGSYTESKLDSFCNRQFGKKLRKLSSDDAIKLIEIQKTLLRRKIKEEEK